MIRNVTSVFISVSVSVVVSVYLIASFQPLVFWYPHFNYARAHDADDIQESAIRANFEAFAR